MKKLTALLMCMLLALSCFAGAAYALEPGDEMPDFTVELCDGSVFTLSEALEGHDMVLINIWASWCGPCRMEFPYMEEAYMQYSDRVAVVCLSCETSDTNASIAQFKQSNKLTALPMGQDTIGLSYQLLEGYIPMTVIVDRYGKYAYSSVGAITDSAVFMSMFDYFLNEGYDGSEMY